MKNIILYIIISTLLLPIFFSCADKLDLKPRSMVSPESLTDDDLGKILDGAYSKLRYPRSYWFLSFVTEDLSADNLIFRATFFQHGEIDDNNILADNLLVLFYYQSSYYVIQTCNDVLIATEKSAISEDKKAKIIGQAKTIRAFAYYKLVTLFGGVPIIETRDPDKQLVPRSSEKEVWNYIIEDLKSGLNAPDYSNVFYVSKEAAKALLARAYLLTGNNSEAKKLADEVIASGKFTLNDANTYNSIWDITVPSKEVIFAVQNTPKDRTNFLGYYLRHPSMSGGRGELPVDASFLKYYDNNDIRLSVIKRVKGAYNDPKFEYFCYKYQDPSDHTSKFYIVRLAEMYLISAEAGYNLNPADSDPINKINTLRAKRNAPLLSSIDLHSIIEERRLELAFENFRWTDMKRTPSKEDPLKSMAQVFLEKKKRTKNDMLYPIPTSAIEVNPLLEQNPGY